MTDKNKAEELSDQELDQVTGGETEELFGAYNNNKRKIDGIKNQLTNKANPLGRAGIRATSKDTIVAQAGDGQI